MLTRNDNVDNGEGLIYNLVWSKLIIVWIPWRCIVRDISPSQDGWHSFNQASWSLDVSQLGITIPPTQSLNEPRR